MKVDSRASAANGKGLLDERYLYHSHELLLDLADEPSVLVVDDVRAVVHRLDGISVKQGVFLKIELDGVVGVKSDRFSNRKNSSCDAKRHLLLEASNFF